jgi:allantoin racemase
MARILVVNSNSSKVFTERIERTVGKYSSASHDVTYVNAAAGPEGIDSALDIAVSGVETARAISRERDAFDAFIVACGNDPGLDAARQVTDKPVVGIAEAGILFACVLGAKFSVLTLLRSEIPLIEEMVDGYGLRSRLASVATLGVSAAEAVGGIDSLYDEFRAAGQRAKDEDMAEVLVLVGSIMCGGIERQLTDDLGIPVLSGIVCALKMAEDLAELGVQTSRAYKYAQPAKQDRLIGYDDLAAVYSGAKGESAPESD